MKNKDSTKKGGYVKNTYEKKPSRFSGGRYVVRDSKTGKFVSSRSDKNSKVLAATIGGAVIGNILFPGIGGAILGGIAGAIVGNKSDEGCDNE